MARRGMFNRWVEGQTMLAQEHVGGILDLRREMKEKYPLTEKRANISNIVFFVLLFSVSLISVLPFILENKYADPLEAIWGGFLVAIIVRDIIRNTPFYLWLMVPFSILAIGGTILSALN